MNAAAPRKKENVWLNIALNVAIPAALLIFVRRIPLEPTVVALIAFAFPFSYGIWDFISRKKVNFFSILGIVNVMISGSVFLFDLSKDVIIYKEAGIPALFAVAVYFSLWTPFPLVRTLLFTPEVFDVERIEVALEERGTWKPFNRLMTRCTMYLAASFALSAVLNFVLAKYFIRSDTEAELAEEVGRMTLWSYPIIMVPMMVVTGFALWQLITGIQAHTGYEIDDILVAGRNLEDDAAEPEAKENEEGDAKEADRQA